MKAYWARLAERIDAATLRERMMVFLALALVLVFIANAALIEPQRAEQKRIAAETARLAQELLAVQARLAVTMENVARDPDGPNRLKLAALREQLTQINARAAQEQRRFTPPDRIRDLLEDMLRRNRGLSLVDLKTLPVTPIGTPARGASAPGGVYRHGIEFTVSGSYQQLYEYLRTLEQLPTQLYWGRAELSAGDHPLLTLKLTAYTVSFDPAWLIV